MINALPERELFAPGHTACAGCAAPMVARIILKVGGPETIVCSATGCMEVFTTPHPRTSWQVPWIHAAFENNAAVASGIDRALRKLGTRDRTNLVVLGGDGATFDIGFGAISGALERGQKFTYVCYDNEAYMNCLSLSSLIMTENGLKKINEVRRGDLVYAFNQKTYQLTLKRCAGVFDNGRKRVYQLSTLHHDIKATANHPFLVLKRNGRGRQNEFVWKTLEDLKKGDDVVVLKKLDTDKQFTFSKFRVSKKGDYKVNRINKIRLPERSSSDLMRFLGLYVGDGWVRVNRAETGFALPKGTEGRKELLAASKKIFGIGASRVDDCYVYFNSINLTRFIASLGFGEGAKNKTVPDWVFTLPEKEKAAFVKGLMLSDGYRTGNSYRYVSASFELLRRLRMLLQTQGYRVGKIHKQVKKKGAFVVYRKLLKDSEYGYICFSKRDDWNIKKYPQQYKYQNFLIGNRNFETEKVVDVKFVAVEPTLDLRVDGEHNFIADGIVVHNTGIQRSGATPKYASTTTTPAGKVVHGKTEFTKQLPFIVAAHGAYVATANIAFPQDFAAKLKKSFDFNGPSYIQVFSPCPTGWYHPTDQTVEIAKLAFKTNVYPLYEIEGGVLKLNRKPTQFAPVEEYLMRQGRFKHLTKEDIADIQQHVNSDWERLQKLDESKLKLF
jgi:pyruvate/2-oxoacid:ferredoxin oxidoreductase beta subunit